MDKLQKTLPNIIKQALCDEDETTRSMVLVLLNEVYASSGKRDPKQVAQRALDDYIEKAYKIEKSRVNYGI